MFALAIGGIVVPKLNLILSLVCREYLAERSSLDPSLSYQEPSLLDSDNPQCRIPEVQSLVTKFALYMSLLTGILSSIMSPRMGALSDRYGRVKFLVITSLGGLMMEVITILAGRYPDTVHYRWILAGSIVDGLCGSFTAGMALTHAYAADCTAPPKRAVAFGYFHACLFSGIAIGPLFAAYILRMTGSLVSVFFVALGIHATFILFMLFAVPESLTEKRRSMARERHLAKEIVFPPNLDMMSASQNVLASTGLFIRSINPFSPLKILWPTGPRTSNHLRANLVVLASVDTIVFGVAMGSMAVLVYYTGFQFGWGSADTSIFVSIVNSSRVFALVAILPLFNYLVRTRRRNKARRESGFDIPERNSGSDSIDLFIIRISIVFEIVGYAIYATARTGPLFILGGVLASLGGIGSPTLGAALTKHVPHERVGQLLGATGLLHAQARIVGPAVFNFIYAETVGSFPQAVFVCLTACFGVAFLVSWFIRPNGEFILPLLFSTPLLGIIPGHLYSHSQKSTSKNKPNRQLIPRKPITIPMSLSTRKLLACKYPSYLALWCYFIVSPSKFTPYLSPSVYNFLLFQSV